MWSDVGRNSKHNTYRSFHNLMIEIRKHNKAQEKTKAQNSSRAIVQRIEQNSSRVIVQRIIKSSPQLLQWSTTEISTAYGTAIHFFIIEFLIYALPANCFNFGDK